MESPGRLGLSRALVACALLVAPSFAASGRPSWRDAHSKHETPSSQGGSHHPTSASTPRVVRTEAGVPVGERDPVLWTLMPSPFMEELQMLAAKGDSYATLAPQKWDAWRAWKATFRPGKQYESVGTEVQAFRAFIENDQVIATHNADHASSYYSLGHSEWSATSFHEFENLMFPVKTQDIMPPVHGSSGVHSYLDKEGKPKQIPASVDWTEEGAVSPVGNQGECGSCWCARARALRVRAAWLPTAAAATNRDRCRAIRGLPATAPCPSSHTVSPLRARLLSRLALAL